MSHLTPSAGLIGPFAGSGAASVVNGAGTSAEGAFATVRGPRRPWREHSALERALPEALAADPRQVWRFFDGRRVHETGAQIVAADPEPAQLTAIADERSAGPAAEFRPLQPETAGCAAEEAE